MPVQLDISWSTFEQGFAVSMDAGDTPIETIEITPDIIASEINGDVHHYLMGKCSSEDFTEWANLSMSLRQMATNIDRALQEVYHAEAA